MKNCTKKYRFLICLLFPFYVNFFFITPFLHYHPAEENSFQSGQIDIHSHLINGHDDNHNHEANHHLDDCRNHEQVYELNTYQFTSTAKSIKFSKIFVFYRVNYSPPKSSIHKLSLKIVDFIPSKLHWEKSVYFATNVSPPIV